MAQEQPRDVAGSPMMDLPEDDITIREHLGLQTRDRAVKMVLDAQPGLGIVEALSRAKMIADFIVEGKVPLAAD